MSGKHRYLKGKHRAYNPHLLPALGAVGIGAAVTATTIVAATGAHADPGSGWDQIAACESSGNWAIHTGSFEGGLQFSPSTWIANGGGQYAAHAYQATKEQQIAVARRVLATQGIGAWPVCGKHASTSSLAGPTAVAAPSKPAVVPAPAAPRHAAPEPTQPQPKTNPLPALPAYTGPTTSYMVAADDTLTQIAEAHQIADWQRIVAANLGALTDPDQIQVGQQLKLPAPVEPAVVPLGQPQPVKLTVPPVELKAFAEPVAAATVKAAPTVKVEGTSGGIAARAVAAALGKQGTMYSAMDCSALVQYAFRTAGVSLPRVAAAQATMGRPVSVSQLRAGDVLTYYSPVSHVAIYIGGNKIVESSQPGKPIAVRSMYLNGFAGARRIVG